MDAMGLGCMVTLGTFLQGLRPSKKMTVGTQLGDVFKYALFSPIFGEEFHFD